MEAAGGDRLGERTALRVPSTFAICCVSALAAMS
jgi:hypothetical protein